MDAKKPKIICIVGATSTGKSDMAVALAKAFGGEVVSADSRQVYKGLDIGTGKVTRKEMRGVPHHLINVASPKRPYSAARYQKDATRAVHDILKRGHVPIICGGTGFYIDSLLGKVSLPEVSPNRALRARLQKKSTDALFSLLKKIDPKRARTIDRHNPVRLIRAIEIAKELGAVPTVKAPVLFNAFLIGLTLPQAQLRALIHTRLKKRMKLGMVQEAQKLHNAGLSWRRMEELGLEYRYLSYYLTKKLTKEKMLTQLETEIVRYAKRQQTWFKRDTSIHWVAPNEVRVALRLAKTFLQS